MCQRVPKGRRPAAQGEMQWNPGENAIVENARCRCAGINKGLRTYSTHITYINPIPRVPFHSTLGYWISSLRDSFFNF